ncbi:hypothetical protein [Actinoplanes rectilineatus]|uniref:hypothetical protein n=1 Tax=Actinoplanes rectilineatus TaxID=113571 RepID=UPI0005F29BD0|nr:hypothetical protein [Actinoplanes rectilineatus]
MTGFARPEFTADTLARGLVRALTTDGLLMLAADVLNELHRRDGETEIVKGAINTHHAEICGTPGAFHAVYWGGAEGAMESLTPTAQIDRARALVEQLWRKALDAPVSARDLNALRAELGSEV